MSDSYCIGGKRAHSSWLGPIGLQLHADLLGSSGTPRKPEKPDDCVIPWKLLCSEAPVQEVNAIMHLQFFQSL